MNYNKLRKEVTDGAIHYYAYGMGQWVEVSEEVYKFMESSERKERYYRSRCRRHHVLSLERMIEDMDDNENIQQRIIISANKKNIYGSYVHGLFDLGRIANTMVKALAVKKGITIEDGVFEDYQSFKEKQYDKLADTLRAYLNMAEIYGMLKEAHLE